MKHVLCNTGAMAGGEALVAADTAAALAAREAASGAWLAELESGECPRVVAPGLPHGVFGAWAQPELPNGTAGESQPQSMASSCLLSTFRWPLRWPLQTAV